jgi:tetratricopeptide (TPR) repeat protein
MGIRWNPFSMLHFNVSPGKNFPMSVKFFQSVIVVSGMVCLVTAAASAQSTRPRRTQQKQDSLLLPQPTPTPAPRNNNVPLLDVKPVKPVGDAPPAAADTPGNDTTHAYTLFQQKQYAAAAKEAKQIAEKDNQNSEAWKLAGFSELALKQYPEASSDLQKAADLQRAAKQEDAPTIDALAQAYFLAEKFDRALPLLVTATTRTGAKPDALLLYYRGLSEYKTGKVADAEKTFNAVVKLNPKDSVSLYYLGQIALAKNDLDGAIAALNRATVIDPKLAAAWTQLTSAYLRRAASATDAAKADADYLNAVRSGEGLIKVRTDPDAIMLFGQALIGAKQYPRAATALERATAGSDANEVTFYLLGVAQSRAKNFPKAIAALERAAEKKPDDVNVYRELGYAYEVTKQYAKALTAYQKGLDLAPGDSDFKESVERVRPFAK